MPCSFVQYVLLFVKPAEMNAASIKMNIARSALEYVKLVLKNVEVWRPSQLDDQA